MTRVSCLLLLWSAGCTSGYSAGFDVSTQCLPPLATIALRVTLRPQNEQREREMIDAGLFFSGSHRVVVIPPAGTSSMTLRVDGFDASGGLMATTSSNVEISGHRIVEASLVLTGNSCSGDGGVFPDLLPAGCASDAECGAPTPHCEVASVKVVYERASA